MEKEALAILHITLRHYAKKIVTSRNDLRHLQDLLAPKLTSELRVLLCFIPIPSIRNRKRHLEIHDS